MSIHCMIVNCGLVTLFMLIICCWLRELSYRAYRLDSTDDLTKPFVSMYFGAAYLAWLSDYEGR